MRRPGSRAAATALAFLLPCLAVLAGPQADSGWAARQFPRAFEDFFSIQNASGDFIAVRVHRADANDLLEYSVILEDAQDHRALRAVVREARGASLFQQLAALHARRPAASYEQLKGELKVAEWKLSAGQCPAIAAQLRAFEGIDFVRPRDDDPVAAHPVLYEFNETLSGGGQVLEYEDSRPLPRWARATRQALDACIAAAPAGKAAP